MARDKVSDAIVEALKAALTGPREQRLHKSGKLEGLFASRAGVNGDAATRALREGLLEITRTEARGKSTFEWVRLTPRGVEYLSDAESPVRALEDLRTVLQANQAALPGWLDEMRRTLRGLAETLEVQARAWAERLDGLRRRVDETLDRMEQRRPPLPEDLTTHVPWAGDALDYLEARKDGGATAACPMPELFDALSRTRDDLSLPAFHDGLRHLHDRRALRLLPSDEAELPRPEFALFDGERVCYAVAG